MTIQPSKEKSPPYERRVVRVWEKQQPTRVRRTPQSGLLAPSVSPPSLCSLISYTIGLLLVRLRSRTLNRKEVQMATTPATPVIASIPTLSTEWTWIKTHKRVILVFMALIVIA